MPQTFQVLKCYKCLVFQIHQTKKSNKFECKMCGEKQSIKRHYGIGTGKDCRLHVQRLNSLSGDMEANAPILTDNDEDEYDVIKTDEHTEVCNNPKAPKQSKWSTFVDEKKENDENATEEPMFLGDIEVLLELPQKQRKRRFKLAKATHEMEEHSGITTNNPSNSVVSDRKMVETIHTDNYKFKNDFTPVQYSSGIKYTDPKNNVNVKIEKMAQNQDALKSINKTSKWAQFVECKEDIECDYDDLNEESSKSGNLFSLCDDSDLDNVLDI